MTVAMPFLQKLITFLWPPDIGRGPPFLERKGGKRTFCEAPLRLFVLRDGSWTCPSFHVQIQLRGRCGGALFPLNVPSGAP